MRQVVLDTETTGIGPEKGHRIIEIGCVELIERKLTDRYYHQYINPERSVDPEAQAVHGISNDYLADKPIFTAIVDEFIAFIQGADLIIHNAPFDVGFINNEFFRLQSNLGTLESMCTVTDSLVVAKDKHPGQKNNLDALCRRYGVDNSSRTFHGALLDAKILADVYLLMTGGQAQLKLAQDKSAGEARGVQRVHSDRIPLPIIKACDDELKLHELELQQLDEMVRGSCAWRKLGRTDI